MPRRKQVEALPLAAGNMSFAAEDKRNAKIAVGDNPGGTKTIDLTHWLDHGIDDWLWACVGQLRLFVQDQGAAPSTICSYGLIGIPTFFKFLVSVPMEAGISKNMLSRDQGCSGRAAGARNHPGQPHNLSAQPFPQ